MEKLYGKGISNAVVIGKLCCYVKQKGDASRKDISSADEEYARFIKARSKAMTSLLALYKKAIAEGGHENSAIFDTYKVMLEDDGFADLVKKTIDVELVNAEYAVNVAAQHYANVFRGRNDMYMKDRAVDILDISQQLINILLNVKTISLHNLKEPVIIAADDLSLDEIANIDYSHLLGLITKRGTSNSHTAIIARSKNLPAVVNISMEDIIKYDGCIIAADGISGEIYINPDEETTNKILAKEAECEEEQALCESMIGKPSTTLDGRTIDLNANVGNLEDVFSALISDAEGIGLFRSDFLYLGRKTFPTEEEQFSVYRAAAIQMSGKRVVIRTMDLGADRKINYLNIPYEENPAMGYRAIRICLNQEDIFKTQLRAIFRASAFGEIALMLPMIISLNELLHAKEIIAEVRDELSSKNIDFDETLPIGIMIETPAAALISDILAEEVDFLSIGTNDLTQYVLAVDRQNQMLEGIYDNHHPAIMRLISYVIESGHKAGIRVAICGELADDLTLTEEFLRLGVDELSVNSYDILPIRKIVRQSYAEIY